MANKSNQFIRILQWIAVLYLVFDIYEPISREMAEGNFCPKVLGIPSCYIIGGSLLAVIISFLFKKSNFLFGLGAGIGWSFAVMATYNHFKGIITSPNVFGEIPACYVSLGLFTMLLLLDQFRK